MRRLLAGLVLGALALLSSARAPIWRSDVTVWAAAVSAQPSSPRAWLNLGAARLAGEDFDGATAALYRGWRLGLDREPSVRRSTTAVALANLALVHFLRGDRWGAKVYALDVVTRFPTWPEGRAVCATVSCLG